MSRSTNDVLAAAFYTVAAGTSVLGATQAAVEWSGWSWPVAAAAVGAFELGGVVLAGVADDRRAKGERALDARFLSGAIAISAAALQWVGHDGTAAGFFPALSLAAYATYLIRSRYRRRDALRDAGMLGAIPPVYGVARWCRSPWLTRRARSLAMADQSLGLHGSLAAAVAQVRAERRRAAISKALRRKLTSGRDKVSATIAVNTYDLDRVAEAIADAADYDGLAALLSADLAPDLLAAPGREPVVSHREPVTEPGHARVIDRVAEPGHERVSDPVVTGSRRRREPGQKRVASGSPARVTPRSSTAADRVMAARLAEPDATRKRLAELAGVSESTVKRYPASEGQSGSPFAAPPADLAFNDRLIDPAQKMLTGPAHEPVHEHVNGTSVDHLIPTI